MRRHIKTIRAQLFIYYSALVTLLFLTSTGVVYTYVSDILRQRAKESLGQMVQSLTSRLDSRLRVMNETSIRVAYSNLVKERFDSYRTVPEAISNYYDQRALRDIFIAIMGPLRSVLQLNLYDFAGTVVGAGYRNYAKSVRTEDKSWYSRTVALEGSRYFTAPYVDDETEKRVIGLCRVYYDNANVPVGIIETLQEYSLLFAPFIAFRDNPPGGYDASRVYVIDDRNRLLFPLADGLSTEDLDFVERAMELADAPPERNPYPHGREFAAFFTSAYSDWTVILAQPTKNLQLPVQSFSRLIVFLLAVSIGLGLVASFLLAKRLALPIDRIHSEVRAIDIDSTPHAAAGSLGSGFNELEDLYESFKQMGVRLKRSMAELIDAKSQEMNAHLLALQSQMNPHFLYNTLSIISILAEEHETASIVKICDDFSSMLRYISSHAPELVPLAQEIDHTIRYLKLMKYRYEEDLDYRFDVPEPMSDIRVPKLIVQPLVENAMKYGIHTSPPWHIYIRGRIDDGVWTVEVTDSGPGFDEQKLAQLRERLDAMGFDRRIGGFQVEGIGLPNICTRLRLLYADRAVFVIENGPTGGARVLIGGDAGTGGPWS